MAVATTVDVRVAVAGVPVGQSPPACTITVPTMPWWKLHTYGNVPWTLNCRWKVPPGAIEPLSHVSGALERVLV